MTDGTHPGLFVTLDGMAGAGKTTTSRLLGPYLRDRGYQVHITAEPTHGEPGELARHKTDLYQGHALACLIAADRYHHLATEIRPRVQQGEIVLCDRYVASSYVLQQMDGVPLPFIECLNGHSDRPDLAVMLLTDAAEAAARVAARGAHDRFQVGISTSRIEARMYREAASYLAGRGVPVLTIDTTRRDPRGVVEQVAERIAERITENTQGASGQEATA
ncbi:dTMP kinase [Thermocrispum municipale]|uniref:dTMP kinase n=1 Tax=Thermocrispum municipale TaxID=37926 RepID=UPI0003FE6018|nr:dTMP kinase [Thermocrispum municipale]